MKRILFVLVKLLMLIQMLLLGINIYAVQQSTGMNPVPFLYIDKGDPIDQNRNNILVVMPAEKYKKIFKNVPFERMLRAQLKRSPINKKTEYIVLNYVDLRYIDKLDRKDRKKDMLIQGKYLNDMFFVRMNSYYNGHYIITKGEFLDLGKIKRIQLPKETGGDSIIYLKDGTKVKIKEGVKHSHKEFPHIGI